MSVYTCKLICYPLRLQGERGNCHWSYTSIYWKKAFWRFPNMRIAFWDQTVQQNSHIVYWILRHINIGGHMVPVWNDLWWLWWPMIPRDRWDLSFPDIFLTVEEKPQKKLNQKNWPDWGLNPGLLRERHWCYPSTIAVIYHRTVLIHSLCCR